MGLTGLFWPMGKLSFSYFFPLVAPLVGFLKHILGIGSFQILTCFFPSFDVLCLWVLYSLPSDHTSWISGAGPPTSRRGPKDGFRPFCVWTDSSPRDKSPRFPFSTLVFPFGKFFPGVKETNLPDGARESGGEGGALSPQEIFPLVSLIGEVGSLFPSLSFFGKTDFRKVSRVK